MRWVDRNFAFPDRPLARAWVTRYSDGRYGVVQHSAHSLWAIGGLSAAYLAGALSQMKHQEAEQLRAALLRPDDRGRLPNGDGRFLLGVSAVPSRFMARLSGDDRHIVSEGYYERIWIPEDETLYLRAKGLTADDPRSREVVRGWGMRGEWERTVLTGLGLRGETEAFVSLPADYATRADPLHLMTVPRESPRHMHNRYQVDVALALVCSVLDAVGLATDETGDVEFPPDVGRAVIQAAAEWRAPEINALLVQVREIARSRGV